MYKLSNLSKEWGVVLHCPLYCILHFRSDLPSSKYKTKQYRVKTHCEAVDGIFAFVVAIKKNASMMDEKL